MYVCVFCVRTCVCVHVCVYMCVHMYMCSVCVHACICNVSIYLSSIASTLTQPMFLYRVEGGSEGEGGGEGGGVKERGGRRRGRETGRGRAKKDRVSEADRRRQRNASISSDMDN